MKYYVIHSPEHPERKKNLRIQFAERGISVDDVTWVEGLNTDDHFCKWVKVRTKSPMSIVQVASAIRQFWIVHDMVDDSVIIFEDAECQPTFPRDASLDAPSGWGASRISNDFVVGDFQDLVDEYRSTMTIMYPQKGHGFANTLIHLTDFYKDRRITDGVVHASIGDYELGQWLNFKFPTTSLDGIKTVYEPKIYINPYTTQNVHPNVRFLVEPSIELKKVLDEHAHFVHGVSAGLHVRRGASAKDSRIVVEVDTDTFANDAAVAKFKSIAGNFGPVFLASDSPETKKEFYGARTLDTTIAVVHGMCPDAPTKDRRNVFLDFFLLSMCPKLFVTGGNFPGMPGLSTFGYMAAQYGGVPWEIIKN